MDSNHEIEVIDEDDYYHEDDEQEEIQKYLKMLKGKYKK